MHKLTKYLIDHAEELIDNPIRPTEQVMARGDAPLYIWKKMGMTHQILADKNIEDDVNWRLVAPAAHLYLLDAEELKKVNSQLDKFYMELKHALGTLGKDLWYLVKSGSNGNEWFLYKNTDCLGNVDVMSTKEVEYATDPDSALINLMHSMINNFPIMCELASCIVLPFGCRDITVWKYAGTVALLGKEETEDFQTGIVNNFIDNRPTVQVVPRW